MNALRLWFAGRSRRERNLVLVALALAALLVAWACVLRPLGDALSAAHTRVADAAARLADTRAAADAVRAGARAPDPALAGPLADAVRRSAADAGFALTALDPAGPGRVRVTVAPARGGALVGWLARLEAGGVLVEAAKLTGQADGQVGAELTLVGQGR